MANIAIVHHDLMIKGGGESVCMNTLEALQDEHDITLVTLHEPDIDELNDYFKTNVDELPVRRPPLVGHALGGMKNITNFEFDLLKSALLNRYIRRKEDEFDIIVSTTNELAVNCPSIQYIHLPQFDRAALPDAIGSFENSSWIYNLYDQLCITLAGFNKESIRDDDLRLVTNSQWTANIIEQVYDETPEVIYPPVDTQTFAQFGDIPWSEKENSFVTIGRILPLKNILRVIDIVKGLRNRGHDVSLRIYGPPSDEKYFEKVRKKADNHDYVHLEGELRHSNKEQMRTLCRQRYYINGYPYEAFGISIAEMVASGAIPFVPNDGGQTEIVEKREELMFETVDEAVDKIEKVLTNEELSSNIKKELSDRKAEFTYESFQSNIRAAVNELLQEQGGWQQ